MGMRMSVDPFKGNILNLKKNTFKNKKEAWFIDGDEFVVFVFVNYSNLNGEKEHGLDVAHIRVDCGDDFFSFVHASGLEEGEPYDAWKFRDVDYYIPINAIGPKTRKQIERFL